MQNLHAASRLEPAAPNALRLAYEYFVFWGALAAFGIPSFLWSLCAAALYPILPARFGEPIGQFMIMAGFRYFVAVMRVSGIIKCDLGALDALASERSIVVAPNHPALLDAVLVVSRLPRVVCIMKREVWHNLFLGGGARLAGYIRNDSKAKLVRDAALRVRQGNHLLIFPEGTRTRVPPVDGFKGGFALIAKNAGAAIQTVFLESNTPYLGKGWSLFRKPQFPLIFRARLGRRFEVGPDVHAFVRELEQYYRRELGG